MAARLPSRLKALITGLKSAYAKYKELRGEELPFNCETLQKALSSWSRKDHRTLCSLLVNFDFPSPEELVRVSGFTKPVADICDYVQQVVTSCHEVVNGESPEMQNLIEKIQPGTCARILRRLELFESIRKNVDCPRFKDDDIALFRYLAENGLMSLADSKLITECFVSCDK